MFAFFSLSSRQKWWFIEAWLRFALWHVRIRHTSYHAWQTSAFPAVQHEQGDLAQAQSISRIVEKASRHHLAPMNCLRRCLVAMEMLSARNILVSMNYGVKFSATNQLEAHCWLTLNGELVNDSAEEVSSFTTLTDAAENTALIRSLQ